MNNPQLQAKKRQIDSLFTEIDSFAGDPIIKAYLTYYLCVRVSGFVEDCVRIIFSAYADTKSSDGARKYIANKLDKFPNPMMDAIFQLAKDFDETWREKLKRQIDVPKRQSLESVVKNRNNIAHGGNSTITLTELKTYYQDIIIIVSAIEQHCQ